ncbi:MAG TPA: hypothetical protein VFT74_21025, partial [Isosphaeraceae bacterium]|nr:hypothetical protein [Isosphaeraceae bacterium]
RPEMWVEPFAEAGATDFVFCRDTIEDFEGLVSLVSRRGLRLGVSLKIGEDLDSLEGLWPHLNQVTIFGTEVGIKGVDMDPATPEKVARARRLIRERNLPVEIEVDGGIRRNTVPLLAEAGADWIVPGSLLFQNDPSELRRWLDGLPTA